MRISGNEIYAKIFKQMALEYYDELLSELSEEGEKFGKLEKVTKSQ